MRWKLSCTVPRGEIGGNAGLLLDKNDGEKPWYSVTCRRRYKDKADDEWKDSYSYGQDDLLALAKLLDLAHTWILTEHQQQRAQKAAA